MNKKILSLSIAALVSTVTFLNINGNTKAETDLRGHDSIAIATSIARNNIKTYEEPKQIGVTVLNKGSRRSFVLDKEVKVVDLLVSNGYKINSNTKLNIDAESFVQDGSKIIVKDVENIERKEVVVGKLNEIKKEDSSLYKGETKVLHQGEAQKTEILYKDEIVDGKKTNSKKIKETVVNKGQDKIVVVGTKEKPVETTAVRSQESLDVSGTPTGRQRTFILTFYTNLASENGGYGSTASGESLRYGMVASNTYGLGTRIYLEGFGNMRVADRGGSSFNSSNRLDVFIPRRAGESNGAYYRRVNSMGIRRVTGYIK